MAKITLEWLRQEATPASYQRGGQYYNNVEAVTKSGNYYQAEVMGSTPYQVNIEESSIDVHGFCSCPYSGIGVCKHIVAVSLNILDGNYTTTELAANEVEFSLVENDIAVVAEDGSNSFYDEIFEPASAADKEAFLKQIFDKNPTIKTQFTTFLQSKKVSTSDNILVKEIYQSIRHRLPLLEFQYESEHEIEAFRYENDDLNADNYAEVFAPYGQKVVEFIKEKQTTDALRILFGIYAAVQYLEQLEWRDYPVFADNLYDLKFPFIEWEITAADQLKELNIEATTAKELIDLLFQQEKELPSISGLPVEFVPAYFANLLRVLTTDLSVAEHLLDLLDSGQFYRLENAPLCLSLLERLKRDEQWIAVGEDFAGNSPAIAKQLLQYYYSQNQLADFYRLAQQTFNLFPDAVSNFLLKKVQPEQDRNLYVELLKYYTEHKYDLASYRKLINYLSLVERQEFLERNYHDATFYVQLLEIEQRYHDILEFARQQPQHHSLAKLLQPVFSIFPTESYELLTQRAVQDIYKGEQNQATFRRVANTLQPILTLKGYEQTAKDFGKKLKKKYNNLPLLVEELKRVGF